jgi:predicted RND superfamily exporter protein
VAEDTFGVEMFKQMAVSAPIAMLIIFLLMLFFFRKFVLVISPMIVAMVSVIVTMGLLIATGNTVHIMSSMIPIFIMPIAVLDAVHILSEFFDRYQETKDRKKTILSVMDTLYQPMLYTSLTTTAGFASLALTPIPPVQIFGLFVALGVVNAWFWTILFIPAYVMLIPEKSLANFGHVEGHDEDGRSPMARFLRWSGGVTFKYAKLVIVATVLITVLAGYGISKIRINDNPIKWFNASHPIRVADKVLNEHFAGTYMAYLAFEAGEEHRDPVAYAEELAGRMPERAKEVGEFVDGAPEVFEALKKETMGLKASSVPELLDKLYDFTVKKSDEDEDLSYTWDEAGLFIDEERVKAHVFKQPEVLEYLAGVQEGLLATGGVGKANSLPDLVKTVHRELVSGEDDQFKIPATARGVAECLMQFQNSHRPNDLWHFVTPDFRKCVFWIQLQTGDNSDMAKVVEDLDRYVERNPPPVPMTHRWFGLTYINVVWQDKMVSGMLEAFLGSFLIVFFMMTVIFRSALWGFMSMIPLTVTIGLIYGVIGLVGKDYDMPVAVLSSLSLGLAVDYAIHFLARSRTLRASHGSWSEAAGPVFGEPARAIARNVVVVGFGFLPLLAAPLIPYKTVGTFIAAILFAAGVASLLILPSLIRLLERRLFPDSNIGTFACRCGTCLFAGASVVLLIAVNVHQFAHIGWNVLIWPSIVVIVIIAAICFFMGRSERCRIDEGESK